jgi:hypothetical protein
LLQEGIANTPSKIDPGYKGHLLITAFNHGKRTVRLKRRQRFCALHLLRVDEGARPYDKPGKHIVGRPREGGWRHLRDLVEANIGTVTFIQAALTLTALLVAIMK